MTPSIKSVNIGGVRDVLYGGKTITTGIYKDSVAGRIAVKGVNLMGDDQADREVHGGPYQAVYAYASEDYAWWEKELQRKMQPGLFGENLTTVGIDLSGALIGERWRVGTVLLQVTTPRLPCCKLAMRMDDARFVKRFADALRFGTYFTIVEEGELGKDDFIEVESRPTHEITIKRFGQIYLFERHRLVELLHADLPKPWRESINRHLATQSMPS